MTMFPVQTTGSAPDAARAALGRLQLALGMIPNVAGVIANSAVLAEIFVDLFAAVHAGAFSEGELQVLLLTNAVANRAAWPVAFHTHLALGQGVTRPDVEAIRAGRTPADPRFAALSAFARALILQRGHLGQTALDAFVGAGFQRAQALEVLAVTAASTITNYAASLGQPPLETFLQPHAWTA